MQAGSAVCQASPDRRIQGELVAARVDAELQIAGKIIAPAGEGYDSQILAKLLLIRPIRPILLPSLLPTLKIARCLAANFCNSPRSSNSVFMSLFF